MRRPTFVLALAAAAAVLMAAPAVSAQSGQPLSVELDHTARLQLRAAAGSVIVGNPAVADVTVVDDRTLFVSGRGYGVTEIVVLDGLGRTLYQNNVVVTQPQSGQVRVWRGAAVTDMACAASCAPSARSPAGAPPANTP